MAKPDSPARIPILEAELVRLRGELAILERQWARKHLLAGFGLLALPALYFGALYAVIVLLCTPALVATQAYLIGVLRSECRELIEEAKREIARLRAVTARAEAT